MFLKQVAKDILNKVGSNNLSHVTVVIPGKRARLFMNQYLAEEAQTPVWAPQYKTIDELYTELSSFRKADTITSVCTLYSIYCDLVPDAEPLDEFYSWGEIILSDFDDIDKHLADAEKVFHNVYDIHEISTNYLEPEQIEALSKFFKNFSEESNTTIKERFIRLWQIMPELYKRLNAKLREQGLLYPGALYRDVAERIKQNLLQQSDEELDQSGVSGNNGELNKPVYAFVGFNIVEECEFELFHHYQRHFETYFYWDYDDLYINDPAWEAGLFIHQNLKTFPNALEKDQFDNLRHIKDITFVATNTDNAQSSYIPSWIKNQLTPTENETAIVLADEHMLGNVLHCLPEQQPKYINVSMGYPLSDTPVYSLLNVLMTLYIEGYDAASNRYRNTSRDRVSRHPYYMYIKEVKSIFTPMMPTCENLLERLQLAINTISGKFADKEEKDLYGELYTEALFQCHKIVTRFQHLLPILIVDPTTMRRLMRQVLTTTNIPFHGEPAVGMQVMGLLETRNLNFKHLLMLNVGEGILPKRSDDTSLIPYNLRKAFGLTTMEHKISVFAYYFYRLIARTEHVTLMYNESTVGGKANEMSRFMRQLMAETDLPIKYIRLLPPSEREQMPNEQGVIKTDRMLKKLRDKYINNTEHKLSPTAINTYLNCKLKFYYKYVAGLYVKQDVEDGITNAIFGTIFHDASDLFYRQLMNENKKRGNADKGLITHDMLEIVCKSPETRLFPFLGASLIFNYFNPIEDDKKKEKVERLSALSLEEIREEVDKYFSDPSNKMRRTGMNLIHEGVLKHFMLNLVKYDKLHAPFIIEGLEDEYTEEIKIAEGESIYTSGRIDRLQRTFDIVKKEDGNNTDENAQNHISLSGGLMTVVDYKTGGSMPQEKSLDDIFNREKTIGHKDYYLQTFLYALMVANKTNEPVAPTLFFVNHAGKPEEHDTSLYLGTKKDKLPVKDINDYRNEFESKLKETISSIFDPEKAFEPSTSDEPCKYCDYRKICAKRPPEPREY